jgi:hypothetical protein
MSRPATEHPLIDQHPLAMLFIALGCGYTLGLYFAPLTLLRFGGKWVLNSALSPRP